MGRNCPKLYSCPYFSASITSIASETELRFLHSHLVMSSSKQIAWNYTMAESSLPLFYAQWSSTTQQPTDTPTFERNVSITVDRMPTWRVALTWYGRSSYRDSQRYRYKETRTGLQAVAILVWRPRYSGQGYRIIVSLVPMYELMVPPVRTSYDT